MRSKKSHIIATFVVAFFSLLSNAAYGQLFQEISQTVRVSVRVIEGVQVGPCSFDQSQVCTNENEDGSSGTGIFGLRIVGGNERTSISRALTTITTLADFKTTLPPIREQQTAQVWDKRI